MNVLNMYFFSKCTLRKTHNTLEINTKKQIMGEGYDPFPSLRTLYDIIIESNCVVCKN